jgi:hypothetical protein
MIATEYDDGPAMIDAEIAADYAAGLVSRPRWCGVYQNPDSSFHLLVIDDGGAGILVDRIDDYEAATWLCGLVNAALAVECARRETMRS